MIVGYQTHRRSDATAFVPTFTYRKGTKDEATQARQIKEKEEAFLLQADHKPYYSDYTHICCVMVPSFHDPKEHYIFDSATSKESPELAFANWVRKHCTLPGRMDNSVLTPFRFVGHQVRTFAKTLGLKCAELRLPLSVEMWYDSDYREVDGMILPSPECDGVPIGIALERLGVSAAANFQYGASAVQDILINIGVCKRLGFFSEPGAEQAAMAVDTWGMGRTKGAKRVVKKKKKRIKKKKAAK